MSEKTVSRRYEVKRNGKYEEDFTTTDAATVYQFLCAEMMAKHIHHATYVRRIEEHPNYDDGTRTVTVYYREGGGRAVYRVAV